MKPTLPRTPTALLPFVLLAILSCAPACARPVDDDRERLDRLLDCEGSAQRVERETCFSYLLDLFARWPEGPARSAALSHASDELERWPDVFRTTHGHRVVDVRTGRDRDTLALAREVVDRHAEDSTRDDALAMRAVLGSVHATDLRSLVAHRSRISLADLANGPGASRLTRLTLNKTRGDLDWPQAADWPGWSTLEALALIGQPAGAVSDDALWVLLDGAESLHTLDLYGSARKETLERLREHPDVARRLGTLVVAHAFLNDADLEILAETPALANLQELDLRKNRLSREAVERLGRAPQFAETRILSGPRYVGE